MMGASNSTVLVLVVVAAAVAVIGAADTLGTTPAVITRDLPAGPAFSGGVTVPDGGETDLIGPFSRSDEAETCGLTGRAGADWSLARIPDTISSISD